MTRIEGWARDGLTDAQIAVKMGINVSTLYKYQNEHNEITEALKRGKAPVDTQVENALLKRALGYEYEEVTTEIEETPTGKNDENGKPIMRQKKHVRRTTKQVAPDVLAQIYWLKNRKPDKWRDKPMDGGAGDIEDLNPLVEMLQ